MKRYLFIFALAAVFASCKKKDEMPDCNCPAPTTATVTPANNYFKLAVGNYWIYDNYKIDTNGVQTLISTDSSYVSADTVVNGNTYHKLFDFYYSILLRDSSGFMIDTGGTIHFSDVVFNTPIAFTEYGGGLGYNEQMTVSTPVSVSVPAGTFTSYDWKTTAHFAQPGYPWGATRYAHDYYSENIGKVKQVYFYYSQPDTYERRLIRYHVQ